MRASSSSVTPTPPCGWHGENLSVANRVSGASVDPRVTRATVATLDPVVYRVYRDREVNVDHRVYRDRRVSRARKDRGDHRVFPATPEPRAKWVRKVRRGHRARLVRGGLKARVARREYRENRDR